MQNKDFDTPDYKKPVTPDRELLLWEKWVQIRRDETAGLAKKLNRQPVDLTMNLLDNVRRDKEHKAALEYAQIEKKAEIRGSLWDQPPRLKQRCACEPPYELHRTRAEMGSPPLVEYIGVPAYVKQNEMGMSGEHLRNQWWHLNIEYDIYRDRREEELYERLEKIDPFRPDIDNLIVKGKRPPTPPTDMNSIPSFNLEEAENVQEEPLSGVYALKINNTVFYKEILGQNLLCSPTLPKNDDNESCTTWIYYFNVPVKRAGRCKLLLQNLGTVSLKYCWKKIKRNVPFIPENVYEQVFFFNKNEDVVSPGQIKEICITFVAEKPGIYAEFWELSTLNVCFFDSIMDKLVINLFADAVEDVYMLSKKVEVLKTRINKKAVINLVSEFVEEIFDGVFEFVPQIYPYKKLFMEAEMFVLRNPLCFYHQTEVGKMKALYTEMVPHEQWDLSIGSWRQAMMAKDYDDRMKYYELLRKSHTDFLNPWYEGDGLIKDKKRAVKNILGQFAEVFDTEFARITDSFVYKPPGSKDTSSYIHPIIAQTVHNVLYLRIYDHLGSTIELCAGVLSSLDLNKWMEFNFCRRY